MTQPFHLQTMVILEYCGGGNLRRALQKDGKSATRHLVCPSIKHLYPDSLID
jgi:hypothetical protein